jgi:vacuole membrane protein 1
MLSPIRRERSSSPHSSREGNSSSPEKQSYHLTSPKGGWATPQDIADFEGDQAEARNDLTLLKHPQKTLVLFIQALYTAFISSLRSISKHWIFRYGVMPSCCAWFIFRYIYTSHPWMAEVNAVTFVFEYVVWWVGLGILSSVGLGSGLQSGMLFLYPHIFATILAAQACGHTRFESESNMWFRSPDNLYVCLPDDAAAAAQEAACSSTTVTCDSCTSTATGVGYWEVWYKIIFPCFLQAAGTALGEIPPYWMTYAARMAAIEAGTSTYHDHNSMPEELDISIGDGAGMAGEGERGNGRSTKNKNNNNSSSSSSSNSSESLTKLLYKGKLYMMNILKKHGFIGILLMASIPNPLFDLCGICCGHFLMPFSVFFSATFIGKAIIRNGYQSLVYVAVCSKQYLEKITTVLQSLLPDLLGLDEKVKTFMEQGQKNATATSIPIDSNTNIDTDLNVKFCWQLFSMILLSIFFFNFISAVAQMHQQQLDTVESAKLRARMRPSVRVSITSPKSGRLILPPRTPITKGGDRVQGHGLREEQKINHSASPRIGANVNISRTVYGTPTKPRTKDTAPSPVSVTPPRQNLSEESSGLHTNE